jgi:endoglucanase
MPKTTIRNFLRAAAVIVAALVPADQALASDSSGAARGHTASATRAAHDNSTSDGTISFSSTTYTANENAGRFGITVNRTNDSGPESFYYGITLDGPEAGTNFDSIPTGTQATFAPGQSSYTFYVTIHDQGINGPSRRARAFIYGGDPAPVVAPGASAVSASAAGGSANATVTLLQNDPLDAKNPQNPLGYPQTPTDGDPLQYVKWYVFGNQAAAGAAASSYKSSNPGWAEALHKIAYSPGSGSFRFWMWNEPSPVLARTVQKFLADAEVAQPNTTVALSTYSLVHGTCENPFAIQKRFEQWIQQLADGIGNSRVVLYLEEDSLMESHCLSHAQMSERVKELAYAVNVLSRDPHLLIYMDAGAPDGWNSARVTARLLARADIAQAQGFFVNATHNDWTTTDVHFGQEIAKQLGGKHFIVQTDDNGRGPLVPADRRRNGNEDLCNPPGRGTGPLSWDTGYAYVDGFLWFNNPGSSDGPCRAGDPAVSVFWPSYAVGLVERGTDLVTGPHYRLIQSQTDM